VSIGTVQNAIRFVEDEGHVESKQRIGTLIRDMRRLGLRMRKQTSKRDQAVQAVQVLVVRQGYRIGEFLPSAREIAKMIGTAPNTTRLALEFLSGQGVLESLGTRGNKANWLLQRIPQLEAGAHLQVIESETLIDKIERELKTFIADTCKVGDKLASHLELADHFKVSIKTVHDAMKRLADQGILQSKRGRYGTFILRIPEAGKFYDPSRYNLFVPAKASHFYNYEKVERQMRALIANCCAVGDKLPTMGHLSDLLGVSANTIRKALQNMAKQGVVSFSRGRYGGTFVLLRPDVPEEDIAAIRALLPTQEQADATAVAPPYTWVSINPETLAHIQVQPEEDLQSAQHGSKAP
jgi:DNA-binding GntR family transcriptional regulator